MTLLLAVLLIQGRLPSCPWRIPLTDDIPNVGPGLAPAEADPRVGPTTIVSSPDPYLLPFSAMLLSRKGSITDRNPVIPRCK